MTTESQTIPEDIFNAACGIVMNAKSLKSVMKHRDVADAIAAALLVERERCATIAEEYECSLENYGGSVDAQHFYEGGVGDAALGIARVIRKGGA